MLAMIKAQKPIKLWRGKKKCTNLLPPAKLPTKNQKILYFYIQSHKVDP